MPNRPNGEVSVEYNGTEYNANLDYSDTGLMTAQLKAPLNGIVLKIDDSGCKIQYDETKLEYSSEQAKSFCPFLELYELLKLVCYTEPQSVKHGEERYILEYANSTMSCKAVCDNDGNICEIKTEKMKFILKEATA